MLNILYFASVRERLGRSAEELALPAGVRDVAGLIRHLGQRGGAWEDLAGTRNLRCAVNQQMVPLESPLADGDELAFFPPVTGG
ncbi:molybdopterin converting factor subunit 1 [Accumulibacter sp.]|uniref:molybdopterin converting factor subunit 1 n=1 Tax=Accumulibacter sp. TaxID=2053492 RepID=UPI0025F707BF|nr:molybdopterin converting factor subunit 1 [Accumulibacter sp.]MCM8610485.1 molybdopterin converting factor subunit 1 [Accumulibacter sp.]MCM8634385.1 molybdopterin converting factor subunit 1 [Accumulibacter sp.]MCM8641578.1 molybdopterin converting factor subunit 1 [Accumulibacter sp.]